MYTPTSERHRQENLYIKASANSGKFARQQFRMEVCGLEIISLSPPGGVPFQRIYEKDSGL